MIPKVIHYCWFGGKEKPNIIKFCIASWRKRLPDYEIKEWNENNFDVNVSPFCQEAYTAKKWAFVADYCRMYILATEGGIYLDSDVIILRPFDEFLNYGFCSCQEYQPKAFKQEMQYINSEGERASNYDKPFYGMGIQSGVMMAEKGNPYITRCLKYYDSIHLPQNLSSVIICGILSKSLEPFGYRYTTEKQEISPDMLIEQPYVFANMTSLCKDSYAWHLYYRSWGTKFSAKQRIRNQIPQLYLLSQLLYYKKISIQLIKRVLSI